MKVSTLAAIAASLLLAGTAQAQTVVDFSGTTPGSKPNGFTLSGVSFSDSIDANLSVQDLGGQSIGQALVVRADDPSALLMSFSTLSRNLSLVFGNDENAFTLEGDVALLTLFRLGAQVGQTSVALNRNDLADQTISLGGIDFDAASFVYADSDFAPIELIEVVDNISFDAAAVVPEPATWGLMILGVGAVGGALRRRAVRTAVRFA